MAQIINNVDLDDVALTTASGQKDKLTLKKPVKLQDKDKHRNPFYPKIRFTRSMDSLPQYGQYLGLLCVNIPIN
jgi:hypothetical protein